MFLALFNYLYFRKSGHTSINILILGFFAFTSIAYTFMKYFI